jgi:hypothetical protein
VWKTKSPSFLYLIGPKDSCTAAVQCRSFSWLHSLHLQPQAAAHQDSSLRLYNTPWSCSILSNAPWSGWILVLKRRELRVIQRVSKRCVTSSDVERRSRRRCTDAVPAAACQSYIAGIAGRGSPSTATGCREIQPPFPPLAKATVTRRKTAHAPTAVHQQHCTATAFCRLPPPSDAPVPEVDGAPTAASDVASIRLRRRILC